MVIINSKNDSYIRVIFNTRHIEKWFLQINLILYSHKVGVIIILILQVVPLRQRKVN